MNPLPLGQHHPWEIAMHLPSSALRILAASVILISLWPDSSRALDNSTIVKIGDREVVLVLPEGHCAMDRNNPSDARVLNLIEKGTGNRNEVVVGFADCVQLKDWREGRQEFLDDFGQYQTVVAAKHQDFSANAAALIKQVCDTHRQNGEKILDTATSKVNEELRKQQETLSVNESRYLGVYSQTAAQCSSSVIQNLTTESGQSKTLFAINTTTVLNGKVVFFYVYTKYEGEDSLSVIRQKHGDALDALLQAN